MEQGGAGEMAMDWKSPQSARGELTIPFQKASSQKESRGYVPSKGDSSPCGGQNMGIFSL